MGMCTPEEAEDCGCEQVKERELGLVVAYGEGRKQSQCKAEAAEAPTEVGMIACRSWGGARLSMAHMHIDEVARLVMALG